MAKQTTQLILDGTWMDALVTTQANLASSAAEILLIRLVSITGAIFYKNFDSGP